MLSKIFNSGLSYLITSLLIGLLIGPFIIKKMTKLEIGQTIREEGPESHLKKSGTPTIGGLIIFISMLITILIKMEFNSEMFFLVFTTIAFALIGFLDDLIIIIKKDNAGLSPKMKLLSQIIIALIISIFAYIKYDGILVIPFIKKMINLNIITIFINTLMLVALANAVNLTDGLDGLATSVTIIVLIFFLIITKNFKILAANKFALILIGSLISFLAFNKNPAQIFMGDTGSMGLGGAIGALAIISKTSLIVPIVGGIYLIEALSVIIQVYHFKKTGNRFFHMAPFHHHLEEEGWTENEIVITFSTITIGLMIIAINALF